jgi:hypothetical protein
MLAHGLRLLGGGIVARLSDQRPHPRDDLTGKRLEISVVRVSSDLRSAEPIIGAPQVLAGCSVRSHVRHRPEVEYARFIAANTDSP